ncbi:hypothetical protein VTO42DRAFT_1254 [Malbranchea cinnamomea]
MGKWPLSENLQGGKARREEVDAVRSPLGLEPTAGPPLVGLCAQIHPSCGLPVGPVGTARIPYGGDDEVLHPTLQRRHQWNLFQVEEMVLDFHPLGSPEAVPSVCV